MCPRNNLEWILANLGIIFSHVEENSLFVGQLFVVVHSRVDFDLFLLFFLDVIDMLISLPGRPDEAGLREVLGVSGTPPQTLLDHRFH